jgi:hypothetical protein
MVKHSRKYRKSHRKGRSHRKSHRRSHRRTQRGGEPAPVDYSNPGPMNLNLAQGQQFGKFHANQHGGVFSGGPYPGAVTEPSVLPAGLIASAHLLPLNQAFDDIRGLRDDNQTGGRRKGRKSSKSRKSRKGRKGRKGSRKGRKGSRKNRSRRYRGGDFVRWGGGGMPEMLPSSVADSTKMLISPQLQQQAGLNPEWKLAENPAAFDPLPQPRA